MAQYRMPTDVRFGEGRFEEIAGLDVLRTARGVALLTGSRGVAGSLQERVAGILRDVPLHPMPPVSPQPRPEDLTSVVERLANSGCDVMLGVGGGSVLDVAKGAAFFVRHGGVPVLPLLRVAASRPVAVVAVPTTAGTGSEVTPFATFWDDDSKRKLSLEHDSMFPDVAVVDPTLTLSMPAELTASTGMDALTQACEAYFNRNHNPTSDAHALRAVELVFQALPRAVARGSDREARVAMMRGSLEAGLAFSNTRTTACHSLSYPMTSLFGVAHGRAVGLTLPEVLMLNAAAMEDEGTDEVRREAVRRRNAFCERLGASSASEAAERIRAMMRRRGLPTRLSEVGIDEQGAALIARQGLRSNRMENNPFPFTEDSVREMLGRIA